MKNTNEVSKLTGVSRRTLQYYDEEGMFPVKRSSQNYRLYDQQALENVWKILILKEMGFSLTDIRPLLTADSQKQKECFRLQAEAVKKQIGCLQSQLDFIAIIITDCLPPVPEEFGEMTYADHIKRLRRK